MTSCKNCQQEMIATAQFCSNCGQKVINERLTVKAALRQVFILLTNFERGFWFTIREVFVAPERVIKDYINGRTRPYYHPFKLMFVLISISVLAGFSLGIYETQQTEIQHILGNDDDEAMKRNQQVMAAMRPYMNLITLIIIPFVSLVSRRLFKNKGLNYAEHLVTNSFLFSIVTVLGFFTLGFYYFFPAYISWSMGLAWLISVSFFTYGYKRLFEVGFFQAFFKALLTYVIGYILMIFMVMILTIIAIAIIVFLKKVVGIDF